MSKILIIDPNGPFRRSLKKVLDNRFPFVDIEEAADGKEGADKVVTLHPNLIFLEIHLPKENGLALGRRIKAEHPDIVIIILTSDYLPEYQTAVEESGIEHIVPKDDWTGDDMIALVLSILPGLDSDKHSSQNENLPHGHLS
jgi:DNA-binding NarL/FixJ family response regulator